jgi:hypothetical protein
MHFKCSSDHKIFYIFTILKSYILKHLVEWGGGDLKFTLDNGVHDFHFYLF